MRKLDILIPHWDEKPEEMEPMLDSIKIQQGVDLSEVGVIIAFDGPDATELPLDEWRERYPFVIEDVHPGKGGVSHTRDAALMASSAEYVTYNDADDMYADVCGLHLVFREMNHMPTPQELMMYGVSQADVKPGFDVLVACFREETKDPNTGELTYINHENNSVFCHGFYVNRQFVIDNNIHYCSELQIHEDSFHQILCRELAAPYRLLYCPMPFYMWRWRDNSCCRKDKLYLLKTYNDMVRSNSKLIDEFLLRMLPEKAKNYCGMMVFDAFYTLCKPEWLSEINANYREKTERNFADYFRKRRNLWDSLTPQEKAMISNGVRQRSVMEGMLLEPITCDQWLESLLAKYPA